MPQLRLCRAVLELLKVLSEQQSKVAVESGLRPGEKSMQTIYTRSQIDLKN
jgi:hypothetical protein